MILSSNKPKMKETLKLDPLMKTIRLGLDLLCEDPKWQNQIEGNIGYLCHNASVDSRLSFGVDQLLKLFPKRLIKLFGPQHGLVTDVQDNMVETTDYLHPYYKIPVYSLYSQTRVPTEEMLKGLDSLIIDLQDVGCRIYTYAHTMTLTMEACQKNNIKVIILDRPNPIGGDILEGNILLPKFKSFVGRHPVPVRHAMTMGELALYCQKFHNINCQLTIIPMEGWKRSMTYDQTGLSWLNPSPNLPTLEGCQIFPGTVLLEGCNLSEGRGTTRPLEVIGHPSIEPHSFLKKVLKKLERTDLKGFLLRPIIFHPMFQKHAHKACGGFHIHITNSHLARPWRLGQMLMFLFKEELQSQFEWKMDGYEYQYERPAIDFINGNDSLRKWCDQSGDYQELLEIESQGLLEFQEKRQEILIYT